MAGKISIEYFADFNTSLLVNTSINGTECLNTNKVTGASIVSPVINFLTGVLGNTLALIMLHRTNTETRQTMFYILVAGLAWTDIAGIFLTSPFTIAVYLNNLQWLGGIKLCKFYGFIMICFGLSTPLIVSAMAVERYMALKCRYFYSRHCNRHNARKLLIILWTFVVFFGLLPLIGFGDFALQYPGTWCFIRFHIRLNLFHVSYGYVYAGINLLLIMVMTGCNISVMFTLLRVRYRRRHEERIRTNSFSLSTQDGIKKKKQRDVEMQMIWLMCTITTVFAVCWAPLMVCIKR